MYTDTPTHTHTYEHTQNYHRRRRQNMDFVCEYVIECPTLGLVCNLCQNIELVAFKRSQSEAKFAK